MVGQVLPRRQLTLHDYGGKLFWQVINPRSRFRSVSPSVQLGCAAHFFDSEQKRAIKLFLGEVNVRIPFSYRAASSTAVDLAAVKPFEGEDAALCEIFSAVPADGCPAAVTESPKKVPGTYVIPGQSPTGWNNAQKIGGQTATDCQNIQETGGQSPTGGTDLPECRKVFEWSYAKCRAELC